MFFSDGTIVNDILSKLTAVYVFYVSAKLTRTTGVCQIIGIIAIAKWEILKIFSQNADIHSMSC